MTALVKVDIGDDGWLLLESTETGIGPVKAGVTADKVEELRHNLRTVLRPVAQASEEMLAELRAAGPDQVKVEFGVTLAVAAGAVIAKSETSCHFKITLSWARAGVDRSDSDGDPS